MQKHNQLTTFLNSLAQRRVKCDIELGVRTRSIAFGERQSIFKNVGYGEFAGFRPYQPGEDAALIDFYASARAGQKVYLVREVIDERDVAVIVLLCISPRMHFGSTRNRNKQRMAFELLGSITSSAASTSDRVGLIAFDDHDVRVNLSPRPAKRILPMAAMLINEHLAAHKTVSSNALAGSGFQRALKLLPARPALVIILSDFFGTNDEDRQELKKVAARHSVTCLSVHDPREIELPRALLPYPLRLTDCASGQQKTLWLTRSSRRQYSRNFADHLAAVEQCVKSFGGTHAVHSAAEPLEITRRKLKAALQGITPGEGVL